MRSKLLLSGVLAAAALVLVPVGLAGNGGFAPPPAESPNAEGIRQSYFWIAIFTGAVLVLVQGALLVFIVKYRSRNRPRDEDGPQVHGNTKLEIGWTVLPVLILVAIGSFIFYKLPGVDNTPPASAAGEREDIDVAGHQFYWQFTYPNGAVAVDRMRVPVGKNVLLRVTAPDWDVIHSWWIPQLGGKIDAIPGKPNSTWFRAQRQGTFRGQCAELCGILHAKMTAEVEALPQSAFDSWLDARAGGDGLGEETYDGVCAKCHGLQGQGDIGPPLAGNALLNDAEGIERVIRNGKRAMPPVGKDWGDAQMKAITDYLREEILGGQG